MKWLEIVKYLSSLMEYHECLHRCPTRLVWVSTLGISRPPNRGAALLSVDGDEGRWSAEKMSMCHLSRISKQKCHIRGMNLAEEWKRDISKCCYKLSGAGESNSKMKRRLNVGLGELPETWPDMALKTETDSIDYTLSTRLQGDSNSWKKNSSAHRDQGGDVPCMLSVQH